MASEINTEVKVFRGVKNQLRIPVEHGNAPNENTSVSWSAGSGTDGTPDPQHVNIKLHGPRRAGSPPPSPRRDTNKKTKGTLKWIIIAFVMTAFVFTGLFTAVFVLLMTCSGSCAGVQNAGNFSQQTGSTSTETFEGWKTIVNAALKENDIKIQNLQNELDKKSTEIDGILSTSNATLKQYDIKIKKMQSNLDNKANEIDEIKRRNLPIIESCDDASHANARQWDGKGGIFYILRNGNIHETYCDMTTDDGRWTTFQRRKNGRFDFYRTWEEYADGFGNKLEEFWLGLENIYQLTQDGAYELRVELTDWDGSTAYAKYGTFSISGRSGNYTLTVGQYSGTAGNSMAYNNGRSFSTNDKGSSSDCARRYRGAWWYNACASSNLNGRYDDASDFISGVFWYHWRKKYYYSLKGSEMKFRKK